MVMVFPIGDGSPRLVLLITFHIISHATNLRTAVLAFEPDLVFVRSHVVSRPVSNSIEADLLDILHEGL